MTRLKLHPVKELYHQLTIEGYAPVEEHCFHPTRKWRFDLALPDHRIAVEYEGIGQGESSRHTTGGGYAEDCHKYNAAVLLGWRVLRFTWGDFGKDGYALSTVLAAIRGNIVEKVLQE